MATKQQILDYVEHTPLNTNRYVLEQMLDTLSDGGSGGSNITANVKKEGNVTTITISDGVTTTTAQVLDGAQGVPGQDGISPIVSFRTDEEGQTIMSVTDAEGVKETVVSGVVSDFNNIEEIYGGTAFGIK